MVKDPVILQKLFDELAARYADRPGGYTRIVKLGHRSGDAAPISLIELMDNPFAPGAAPALGDDLDEDFDAAGDAAGDEDFDEGFDADDE